MCLERMLKNKAKKQLLNATETPVALPVNSDMCVFVARSPQNGRVRGGRGVVQIASSFAAVPPAVFDFLRIYSLRASQIECDIRLQSV